MKYLALLIGFIPAWALADTAPVATAMLSCPAPAQLGIDAQSRLELLLSLRGYTPLARDAQWLFCLTAQTKSVRVPQAHWDNGIALGYGVNERARGGWGWQGRYGDDFEERTLNTLTLNVSRAGQPQTSWQTSLTLDGSIATTGAWQKAALRLLDQVPPP